MNERRMICRMQDAEERRGAKLWPLGIDREFGCLIAEGKTSWGRACVRACRLAIPGLEIFLVDAELSFPPR